MTAFHASAGALRAWPARAAIASLLLAGAADVAAQQTQTAPQVLQPQRLQPARPPMAAPPPARIVEPPPRPASPPAAVQVPGGPMVQVDPLRAIDPDTVGTLTEGQGGFGPDMWRGTQRSLVDALLPRLPVNAPSSAVRDLMRRLLLSSAAAPQGGVEPGGLVALRAQVLAAMGDIVGVNGLLNATPDRAANERLLRIEADMRLLANDNARACAIAQAQVHERPATYWQKAFVFCQGLAGEHDKAALGLGLLKELGEKDPVFFALAGALATGAAPALASLADPTPLHLAAARVAKAQLPADVLASGRPGILRTVATSPNAPIEVRLKAAELAEAAGALPIDALRQLYSGVQFSEKDLANALSKAESQGGPMTRALLFRAALLQTVPTAQAEAVEKALALARGEGRYDSAARVFLPIVKRMPVSAELMWFAPEAARALVGAGEAEAARPWLQLLRAGAVFNQDAGRALTRLLPLAKLGGFAGDDAWTPQALLDWWTEVKGQQQARRRAALLFSLFEALDVPVPGQAWDALVEGAERASVPMPDPVLWFRLAQAVKAGRVGETVLLALVVLGEDGVVRGDPQVLRAVVGDLRAVGLKAEARALAVEAALAAGL
jgi:hypothetical protein